MHLRDEAGKTEAAQLVNEDALNQRTTYVNEAFPDPAPVVEIASEFGKTFYAGSNAALSLLFKTKGVMRGDNAPGGEKSQQCRKYIHQYSTFTHKRPFVRTWGR